MQDGNRSINGTTILPIVVKPVIERIKIKTFALEFIEREGLPKHYLNAIPDTLKEKSLGEISAYDLDDEFTKLISGVNKIITRPENASDFIARQKSEEARQALSYLQKLPSDEVGEIFLFLQNISLHVYYHPVYR